MPHVGSYDTFGKRKEIRGKTKGGLVRLGHNLVKDGGGYGVCEG
jgi:hypothetical protein